jgi:hypothetical protein
MSGACGRTENIRYSHLRLTVRGNAFSSLDCEASVTVGTTHVDLYDGDQAMSKLTPFFTSSVGHAEAGTNADRASLVAAK